MTRRFTIAIVLLVLANAHLSRGFSKPTPTTEIAIRGVPLASIPAALLEAWLRYHDSGLSENLDAVFVFHNHGMEVWCRSKDEKGCQDLSSQLDPLRSSYRIDLYITRSDRDKKPWSPDDDEPLPSLLNNNELRLYMRDPFAARFGSSDDLTVSRRAPEGPDPDLKRRLKAYGDQLLDWNRKMQRLANDLPGLSAVAYGTDAPAEVRAHAASACLDHVREVGKDAARLADNLTHAFPRGDKPAGAGPQAGSGKPAGSRLDRVLEISKQAQALAQRVERFLYPEAHTVNLTDLRAPGLLSSLKALQKAAADFENSGS